MLNSEGPSDLLERQSLRERRYDAILDAAEGLFVEQGFDRTRLAEIVQRSGGSLATLYELFGNKQGLLNALALRWRDETFKERHDCKAVPEQTHLEMLMGYVKKETEIWQAPRTIALMRMLVSECLRDRDFALQIYRSLHLPFVAQLSELFSQWAKAGEAQIEDTDAAAHLFMSTITGDMFLSRLFGLEEAILDETKIRWRLLPFLRYFKIAA